jgi:hypothetical protein
MVAGARLAPHIAAWMCAQFAIASAAPAALAQQRDATKAACLDAYEGSQVHRRKEELLAARNQLRACASEACPSIARSDCVQWLGEVDRAVPSVVLEATTDAGPLFEVTATVDGKVIATQLDGRPIELDPGLRTFAFERPGNPKLEQKVIIREGEKSRLVTANWTTPKPAYAAEVGSPVPERPIPTLVYVLTGVGVLGLADFVLLSILGNDKKRELESSCAPFCSGDDVNGVKARYLMGDVGLGVGLLALAGGAALFFARPERVRTKAGLLVAPASSGAVPSAVLAWRGWF